MALARAMGWTFGIVADITFITFLPLVWVTNLYGPGAGQHPATTWVWVLAGIGLMTIVPLWLIGPVAGPHALFSNPLRGQPGPTVRVSITRGSFVKLPMTPTPPPPPDYSAAPGQVFETPRRDPGERYLEDE